MRLLFQGEKKQDVHVLKLTVLKDIVNVFRQEKYVGLIVDAMVALIQLNTYSLLIKLNLKQKQKTQKNQVKVVYVKNLNAKKNIVNVLIQVQLVLKLVNVKIVKILFPAILMKSKIKIKIYHKL